MSQVRLDRLLEDKKKIEKLVNNCDYLEISEIHGNPPTEYMLIFNLKGYINKNGDISNRHRVKMSLSFGYPISEPPAFTFMDGLFHPNVFVSGEVCLGFAGGSWKPAFRIDNLIEDIAKYVCFKLDSYNLNSPANRECDSYWISNHLIPLDNTNILSQEKDIEISIKDKQKIKISINPLVSKSDQTVNKIKINIKSSTG